MSNWELTKGLANLRNQVNAAFPNRDKTSDGTIGDTTHQAETSGHNPDDTRGSRPEWDGDDDANAEVRAWDMDSDLGDPDVTAQQIIDHLRQVAHLDNVLRYMIYNRKIYSAANDWAAQDYSGASAHTEHIHFSGAYTQAADNNTTFDYHLEDLVAISDDDWNKLKAIVKSAAIEAVDERAGRAVLGWDPGRDPKTGVVLYPGITNPGDAPFDASKPDTYAKGVGSMGLGSAINRLVARLDAERAEVPPTADQNATAVVSALRAGSPEATAAALKAVLGDQADEVGRLLTA